MVELPRNTSGGGWTIDPEALQDIQREAGEWAKEAYLETIEVIAIEVERRVLSAPTTLEADPVMDDGEYWIDRYKREIERTRFWTTLFFGISIGMLVSLLIGRLVPLLI